MLQLIPLAYYAQEKSGVFAIDEQLKVNSDFDLKLLKLEKVQDGKLVIKKDSSLDKEEYKLEVTPDLISIKASSETGAYYALQTLRQIGKFELGSKEIPCCIINDKPRFSWRGVQLDESRHFFGKEYVKKMLDMMFMLKLNVFHWHLTDDQGWRIEIRKYPLLTEIGSKRAYTQIHGWGSTDIINEEYSGFYTQDDIKEIVDYAAKRGIMVVPEIDFPAHCAAAIAAYPWLACREINRDVPGYFGGAIPQRKLRQFDWNRPICPGKDKTVDFVKNVIDEVCSLFPAPYFHIGGDEAPKSEWKKCPCCQKRIKDNNLKDEEDLQGWLNNEILAFVKSKGKRLIGWNEVLKAKSLDKSVICQYWTPKKDSRARDWANNGNSVILSNHQSFYFDMTYAQYSLKNTYNYNYKNFGIKPESEKNILGIEAENWTEWTDCPEKLEVFMYPRTQALAEVAWSPESKKEFDSFMARMENFKPYFEYFGMSYAVNSVAMPKKWLLKSKIRKEFSMGDTHLEVKLNKKYIEQGEK